MAEDYSNFRDSLSRLMGLHRLSGVRSAELLGISPQHLSFLLNGERQPTYERLRAIQQLFGIRPDRLMDAPFEDLLQHEFADLKRFRDTERRIKEREQELELAEQRSAKEAK